jgi:uncharacterized protein YjcR
MADDELDFEELRQNKKKKRPKSGIPRSDRKRKICGAKLRGKDRTCQNWAMENGRCRIHGGKTGKHTGKKHGAPVGSKNALKTGERESIWMEVLYDEELQWLELVKLDVESQLNEEIRLMTIRERRMMQRIEELNQDDFTTIETVTEKELGFGKAGAIDVTKTSNKQINTLGQIQQIEEALTRVQEKKAKLLDLKWKIQHASDGDDGSLEQLVQVIDMSRKAINATKRVREKAKPEPEDNDE